MRDTGFDMIIILLQVALFIIEIYCQNPILVGFLRLRCILRIPFLVSLIFTNWSNKVGVCILHFNQNFFLEYCKTNPIAEDKL